MGGRKPFDPGLEALLDDPPGDGAAVGPAPLRIGESRLDADRFLDPGDREALDRARRQTPLDRSVFRLEGRPPRPFPRRRWPAALLLLGALALLALAAWMWRP